MPPVPIAIVVSGAGAATFASGVIVKTIFTGHCSPAVETTARVLIAGGAIAMVAGVVTHAAMTGALTAVIEQASPQILGAALHAVPALHA